MCHFFLSNWTKITLKWRHWFTDSITWGLHQMGWSSLSVDPFTLAKKKKNRAHVNSEWRWYQDMSTEKTCPFHPLHCWIDGKRISTLFLAYWATSWEMTTFQYSLTFSLFPSFISSTFEYGLYCIFIPYQGILSKMRACDGKRNATPWPVTLSRSFSADTRIFDFSKGRNKSVCLIWHRHIAGYQGFWMMIFFALVSMSPDGSTRVMDHRTKGRQGGLEGVLEIWWPTVYRFLPPKTGPLYFQEAFRVRTCTTMRMILCLTTHIYRDVSVQFDGTSRSPATDQWWIYFRINCRSQKIFKK